METLELSLKGKVGIVRITKEFTREANPLYLSALFSVIFPYWIEEDRGYNSGVMIYYCYSDLFKDIDVGMMPPEYQITFKRIGSSIIVEKAEKI